MPVNLEVKGMLARLLATEDIVVEHKKVETACFNVHTRVLTLPMWEKASNNIYDLLVAHECGHSIHTPDDDWTEQVKIPLQYVNIVEDVRVEKLMKRKYPGISKTFFNGYKELAEKDFFQLENENIDTMNFADRTNLIYKIGNFVDIFIERGEETDIIDLIANTETFSDVLIASEALYNYCNKKEQEKIDNKFDNLETQHDDVDSEPSLNLPNKQDGESDNLEDKKNDNSDFGQSLKDLSETKNYNTLQNGCNKYDDSKIKTVNTLSEALKNLVDKSNIENIYVEIPKLNINNVIIPNSTIHSQSNINWQHQEDLEENNIFEEVDNKYHQFKKSAQKEVNYLVKEFECRKAADSYSRSFVARTGVLDCSNLHTYKYNDDLFKKVTTIAEGKNHGLIFILDWSGSMSEVIFDTIKQLFNLVWFCKKTNIPFEVYAFTSEFPLFNYNSSGQATLRPNSYDKKSGLIVVHENFSLMNILTSKTGLKILEDQMKNIFRIVYSFSSHHFTQYNIPFGMRLSGTPLNETLIALHQIIPKFKIENKLQKVQCIILTDGESSHLNYHHEVNRRFEKEPFIGTAGINNKTILRDRNTGNTYSFSGADYAKVTEIFLKNLKDNFSYVNFIGIRLLGSRDVSHFIHQYYDLVEYEKIMNSWKKEKSCLIYNSGYDAYFGLSASTLSQDSEFEVVEDATKSQIKSAFVKSLKIKKLNKKVLGKFMEFVV